MLKILKIQIDLIQSHFTFKVRQHYQGVDSLIASVKAATVKNASRRQSFFDNGLSAPPLPILTRWASWIDAALWYAEHLPKIRDIVSSWTSHGKLVSAAKNALQSPDLQQSLTELTVYRPLSSLVTQLSSTSMTIREATAQLTQIQFGSDPAGIIPYIRKRCQANKAFQLMSGDSVTRSPAQTAKILGCQPTSAQVERSFSILRNVIRPDRQFSQENCFKYASQMFNKNSDV